ncbi:SDR family NAD(P)-dependent oxidoreductase [Actinoplanes sp. CA-142083]|uniref:SDR family NAD(P)-dependent oxidoreductase n=1 Tax=Actinoplanes sp. CA-142083 TaxID=3239903 RepID=UPI003D903862
MPPSSWERAMSKTVVVFGAGTGLGTAVARRFAREGYRVALVARDGGRLSGLASSLDGEAAAFPSDLRDVSGIPPLIADIRSRFGRIDVIEYAPITTDLFTRATELTVEKEQEYLNLFLLSPIAVVREVLPDMLARGDGGILLGQGVSAIRPMPGLSGFGPAMAAARNYFLSLHAELAPQGVYAGVLHVAAMISGSAGHAAAVSGEVPIDVTKIPLVDPADLAEAMWTMLAERDRAEDVVPAA